MKSIEEVTYFMFLFFFWYFSLCKFNSFILLAYNLLYLHEDTSNISEWRWSYIYNVRVAFFIIISSAQLSFFSLLKWDMLFVLISLFSSTRITASQINQNISTCNLVLPNIIENNTWSRGFVEYYIYISWVYIGLNVQSF